MKHGRALLLVVSAPSGAGKTTLCNRLLAEHDGMTRSVSCTTRAPRGAEIDGKDYHFLSATEFDRRVSEGLFLEHAVVHGNQYGTLRSNVESVLKAGRDVLLVIDVQGAAAVRKAAQSLGGLLGRAYVDIFIAPPSIEALRDRLQKRGEDAADVIERRLVNALGEMERGNEYQYLVVNDNLKQAFTELKTIIRAEHDRNPC
ncbi:MAG: guanylate kinase [bacterium]|jgi:guanylate kinase